MKSFRYILKKLARTEVLRILADQDRTATAFYTLPLPPRLQTFIVALQSFGHIQSKNKDAKSAVSFFFNRKVRSVSQMPFGIKRVKGQ